MNQCYDALSLQRQSTIEPFTPLQRLHSQDSTDDETLNTVTPSDMNEVALNGAFVLTATVRKMPADVAAAGVEVDFNEVGLWCRGCRFRGLVQAAGSV
jgi:hypothetical protein